jgi:hypothetical protein
VLVGASLSSKIEKHLQTHFSAIILLLIPPFLLPFFLKKNNKKIIIRNLNLYLMARTADNGGEDGTRSVISGESSLAHTGSIVHNQSRYIIVTHID